MMSNNSTHNTQPPGQLHLEFHHRSELGDSHDRDVRNKSLCRVQLFQTSLPASRWIIQVNDNAPHLTIETLTRCSGALISYITSLLAEQYVQQAVRHLGSSTAQMKGIPEQIVALSMQPSLKAIPKGKAMAATPSLLEELGTGSPVVRILY